MPPLSILVKPASSACNLRCAYCFYADEASNRAVPSYGRMSPQVVRALLEQTAGTAEGGVSFLFQGGAGFLPGFYGPGRRTSPQGAAGPVRHPDQRDSAG